MRKENQTMLAEHDHNIDRLTYWQLIPSALQLEETIKANPPDFVYSFDFFVHLLHKTIEIPVKNDKLRRADGYVPLSSRILQPKNRDYNLHLAYLVENKILEVRPYFTPGQKSRQYRIAENHLKNRLIEIMVSDAKLVKHLAKELHLNFKVVKKYEHLHRWFNDGLEINVEGAMQYCVQRLKDAPYESIYQAHQKVYGMMFMVKMLQHKQYWFSVDTFGHRLHTNLTNLSSELRPFVTYKGQPLVSVDVKNSQPLLSMKILASKYPALDLKTIESGIEREKQTILPTDIEPIMLVKHPQSLAAIDVQRYGSLVIGGRLYDYMEAELRKAFGDKYFTQKRIFDFDKLESVPNTLTPRQRVKKVMFQVFFSKNSTRSKEKKLFAALFPNVMQVFEDCKANERVAKKRRHKMLAQQLQRIESALMLDKVAKVIGERRPDMPIYTVHDCIVTTVGNEGFVNDVMKEIFSKELGFMPTLENEYWCSDCSPLEQAA